MQPGIVYSQQALNEMLRTAVYEVLFGEGSERMERKVEQLLGAGAVWCEPI